MHFTGRCCHRSVDGSINAGRLPALRKDWHCRTGWHHGPLSRVRSSRPAVGRTLMECARINLAAMKLIMGNQGGNGWERDAVGRQRRHSRLLWVDVEGRGKGHLRVCGATWKFTTCHHGLHGRQIDRQGCALAVRMQAVGQGRQLLPIHG